MYLRVNDKAGSSTVKICKLEPIAAESTVPATVKRCCYSGSDRGNRETRMKSFPSLALQISSIAPQVAEPNRGSTLRKKLDVQGPSPNCTKQNIERCV